MNKKNFILEFDQVSFRYFDEPVLDKVTFTVTQGEFVGILGPNGAGKSTLLKLCNRILKPNRGAIFLEGTPLFKFSQRQIAQRVAMVAQENRMPFSVSIHEVVLTGRHPFVPPLGFETREDMAIVDRTMQSLKISHLSQREFSTLSGGEKQRALLATALAQTPKFLLLDEPTSSMDLKHQIEIYQILKKAQTEQGLTILAVTHDINIAAMFCDRLIFLKDGSVIDYGKPDEVVTTAKIDSLYDVGVSIFTHPVHKTPLVFPN